MTISPRSLCFALLLPSLAAPLAAAPVRPAAPTAPATATPDNAIIPLPLNPVVPAAQRLCATRTPSGLGATMLRPATGAHPAASDVVLVNYVGYLAATGAVFDQGMQSPLPVDGGVSASRAA